MTCFGKKYYVAMGGFLLFLLFSRLDGMEGFQNYRRSLDAYMLHTGSDAKCPKMIISKDLASQFIEYILEKGLKTSGSVDCENNNDIAKVLDDVLEKTEKARREKQLRSLYSSYLENKGPKDLVRMCRIYISLSNLYEDDEPLPPLFPERHGPNIAFSERLQQFFVGYENNESLSQGYELLEDLEQWIKKVEALGLLERFL